LSKSKLFKRYRSEKKKKEATDWRKYLQTAYLIKLLYSEYILKTQNNPLKFNNKTNNPHFLNG